MALAGHQMARAARKSSSGAASDRRWCRRMLFGKPVGGFVFPETLAHSYSLALRRPYDASGRTRKAAPCRGC